jgi:sialate O-acetylesterase
LLINLQGIWQFAVDKRRPEEVPQWEKIMVPGAWEFQGFKHDGFARYKRTFNIPANFTKEPVVVILGKIDDFDKTYFNGTVIGTTNDGRRYGSSNSYLRTRVYEIPQELIKRGANNTIEIVVEDMGNVGGIYDGGIIGITTKSNYDRYFDKD